MLAFTFLHNGIFLINLGKHVQFDNCLVRWRIDCAGFRWCAVGYDFGGQVMYDLSILTAEERSLANRYELKEYFNRKHNYLQFAIDLIRISNRRFQEDIQIPWKKEKFARIAQLFLEYSDELFDYVNTIHASLIGFKNIPREDWKRVCSIGSKILICSAWNYETKRLSIVRKWRKRLQKEGSSLKKE
jgi:hypothetical protein